MSKHTIDKAVRSLSKKNDCRIQGNRVYILSDKIWHKEQGKKVRNPSRKNDLGNGSWGKIDFLAKYHDFTVLIVGSFDKKTMQNASIYDHPISCRYELI